MFFLRLLKLTHFILTQLLRAQKHAEVGIFISTVCQHLSSTLISSPRVRMHGARAAEQTCARGKNSQTRCQLDFYVRANKSVE